jgi:hypothetical protein
MKGLFYSWMIFQILVGIWLFISPSVLGGGRGAFISTSNMIFGAIVVILAVGCIFYEMYHRERLERVPTGLEHARERV